MIDEQETVEELSNEAYAIMTGTEKNEFIILPNFWSTI